MTHACVRLFLLFLVATLASSVATAANKQTPTGQDTALSSDRTSTNEQGIKAQQHSVMKIPVEPIEPEIPRVWLSAGHASQCKVGVGESFPDLKLPSLAGSMTDLATLRGTQATIVLFWHPDRWMARTALIDMQRDVAKKYNPKQVSIVAIAVHQPADSIQGILDQVEPKFPQLLDGSGEALAKVGTFSLPRIYVLDPEGTIVWFDIEYSEATRRELQQTLSVLTSAQKTQKTASK